MATWTQALIAFAAIVIAGAIAWGQVTAKQSTDHDLLVEIKSDVKEIRKELQEMNGTIRIHEFRIKRLEEELQ